VERDGKTFEVCSREDTSCDSLAKDQVNSPSNKWNGCAWPATIIKFRSGAVGVFYYSTMVSVVTSFRDSERVDMTVMVEQSDHTIQKYEKKDVPVIIDEKNNIPSASAEFVTQFEPLGVPTIDATEKGGAKGASHSYR
jgi:hypothetical protein